MSKFNHAFDFAFEIKTDKPADDVTAAELRAALLERFPDVKFEVHCCGEDGEQWMIYALGGKTERCGSEVVFTPRTLW